jgi:hypothetical protein
VSLSELQSLSTLSAPQIRDRIYSVGLGLSAVSLPDAMKQLEDELRKLRSPRSGRIRLAERELMGVRAELERVRGDAGRYAEVTAALAEAAGAIEKCAADLDELRARRERQLRLIELRPHWDRRLELERRLVELPEMENFPDNAEQLLENLVSRARFIQEQIRDGDLKQDARTDEAKAVAVVDAFMTHSQAIRRLISETAHYRKAVEDLPVVEQDLRTEEAKLARDVELVGPGWDEARVMEFQSPVDLITDMDATGRDLARAREDYREACAEVRRRDDDHDAGAEVQERSSRERDAVQNVPEEDAETLAERRERLIHLRSAVVTRNTVQAELREAEIRLADIMGQNETETVGGFLGSVWFPVTVVLLGLSTIVYSVWSRELAPALPGALAVAAGATLFMRARAAGQGFDFNLIIHRPAIGEANDILSAQREQGRQRLEESSAEIASVAAECGLGESPSLGEIEEHAAALERSLDRRRRYEALAAAAADADRRLAAAVSRLNDANEAREMAATELNRVQDAWRLLLQQAGLREDLDPSQAGTVLANIQTLKSQHKVTAGYRERVQRMLETLRWMTWPGACASTTRPWTGRPGWRRSLRPGSSRGPPWSGASAR